MRYLFLTLLLASLFAIALPMAQAQTKAKMTICEEIDGRTKGENTGTALRAVKPANQFVLGGVDSFSVLLEFPAFKASQRIDIQAFRIDGESEYKSFGDAVIVSGSDTKAYVIGTYPLAGKYIVKAICDEKVIAQDTFTVTESNNPPRALLSICQDVDNNLNPVGTSSTFVAGTGVKFHAAFPRHNGQRFIFWTIFKVGEDGQDENFVDNFQMGVKAEWKTFAAEEAYTFPEPGKYRVYLLDYEEGNSSDKSGNYQKYFAKADVTIK